MTTRERIDSMIGKALTERDKREPDNDMWHYWNGFSGALNELKLTVKPSEGSIDNEV